MPRYDPSLPPCGRCAGCDRCGATGGRMHRIHVVHADDGRPCGVRATLCGECREEMRAWMETPPGRDAEPKAPTRMVKIPD